MRAGILRLGGAPIQGGLYVSANAWEPHVANLAADLHVGQHLSTMTTTDLRISGLHAPARIAARLWPLDDIADRYRRLREVTAKRRAQLSGRPKLTRIEHLTIALELAVEFTEAMERIRCCRRIYCPGRGLERRRATLSRSAGRA